MACSGPLLLRKSGGAYWTKSEPILSKIQRILRIESRPAFPPASASLRRAKQKNFLYIFLFAHPQNFFQLRKRKFFCFAFLLTQELRKRFPTPFRLRRKAGGQKFIFPTPLFLFARLLSGFARFFFGGGAIKLREFISYPLILY